MGFKKYQKAEKVTTVTDREHAQIRQVVANSGNKSAAQLSDDERDKLPKS